MYDYAEEERLRLHIQRTRARIESLARDTERPLIRPLALRAQAPGRARGGADGSQSAPAARRETPPCLRCGTRDYVVPFHQEGAWICCNVEGRAPVTGTPTYCGEAWHQDVPPLVCPKRACRGGARALEFHYGELGFACRTCARFETLAALALPMSAPVRMGPESVREPSPQKERGPRKSKEAKKKTRGAIVEIRAVRIAVPPLVLGAQ